MVLRPPTITSIADTGESVMSDWDGIPAELRPQKEDVGILLAILMKVIEARAIYRDFDYARSLRAGERRLPHRWESDLVRGTHFFARSEEHTSELQSLRHLVCRLLLEKTKTL